MRRTDLRHHPNILKRVLIHVAGFNLGLVMRQATSVGASGSDSSYASSAPLAGISPLNLCA